MRGIEFRGIVSAGVWVYGHLTVLKKRYLGIEPGTYISDSAGSPFAYKVDPETVGQYIGHTDENNVKIYEGDRLKMYSHSDITGKMYSHSDITGKHEPGKIWGDGKYHEDIRTVEFKLGTFFTWAEYGIEISFLHMARPGESYVVVGNIHTT